MLPSERLREHRDIIQRYLDMALDNISSLVAEAETQDEEIKRLRETLRCIARHHHTCNHTATQGWERCDDPLCRMAAVALPLDITPGMIAAAAGEGPLNEKEAGDGSD